MTKNNEIRDAANDVKSLIRELIPNQETVLDLAGTDENRRLTITYRPLQAEPPEMAELDRAAAVNHVFNEAIAFATYIKKFGNNEAAVVLADVGDRCMVCVLDELMESDRETITMEPLVHPLLKPWLNILNKRVPILAFALEVMRLRRFIVEPDGQQLSMMLSQIKASKMVQIAQGVGRKSLNGVMVEIEIQGTINRAPVELPDSIAIEVPLFAGLTPQRVEMDLLITEDDDEIVAFLTSPLLEEEYVKAFDQMIDIVRAQSGALVGLGRVQTREWATVENPLLD